MQRLLTESTCVLRTAGQALQQATPQPQIPRICTSTTPPSLRQTCCRAAAAPEPLTEGGGGASPPGGSGSGTGGGGKAALGGDGGSPEDPGEDEEYLSLSEAELLASTSGVQLPSEFITAAESGGLRKTILDSYISLQANWLTGFLSRAVPMARDRLLADPRFLFLVFAEMCIDSGCATVAEVRKRGDDFWNEFEFYLSDLVVGLVMDVVLVALMAPTAVLGAPRAASLTGLQRLLAKVPSAAFTPSQPGRRYSLGARAACFGVKFAEYSLAGIVCGLVGQGVANALIRAKRHAYGHKETDVAIPPLGLTALTWGLFMGVSSNVRYQAVFGAERAVDKALAGRLPQLAYVTSLILRFGNNIVGGEQFVDLARWTGVQ